MKIKDNVLHYALGIAVVLSVCLTAVLWVNPTYLQNNNKNSQSTEKKNTASEDASKTSMEDVYQPTSIIYNKNGQSFRQSSSKLDLIESARQDFKTWDIESIGSVKKLSAKRYEDLLKREQMVLMGFPDDVAPAQLKELVKNPPKILRGKKFDRIGIDLSKRPRIYLLNDRNYQATRLVLKKGKYHNLQKIVSSNQVEQTPVELKRMNSKYVSFYSSKVRIHQYSYLANKDNASTFVTRLMGASNASINSRREDQETVYFDNSGQRIAVKNDTGEINYSNYSRDSSKDTSVSQALSQGFNKMQDTGRLLDDVRYDEYNHNDHQLTYRTYINAFPILADNNYGTYHVKLAGAGGERVDFSLYSLQIPVPAKKDSVELPPTQDIMDKLVQNGISKQKIKSIRIGYRSEVNGSSKQVIDLIPTYFIQYNGSWVDYQSVLDGKVS